MTGPPLRVECPLCHRRVAFRKDGTLRRHQAYKANDVSVASRVQFPPVCNGSGRSIEEAKRNPGVSP